MATTPLTSGQWTIRPHPNSVNQTVSGQDWRQATMIADGKKYVTLKLTITGGAIPLTGIPAPGYQSVGLRRRLDGYLLHNPESAQALTTQGVNVIWNYNTTGNRFKAVRSRLMSGLGASLANLASNVSLSGTKTFYVTAFGW